MNSEGSSCSASSTSDVSGHSTSATPPAQGAPRVFPHTRWSVVLAAKGTTSADSTRALETICRDYWYPLYAYVRRYRQASEDAQDLTQEFFARLLANRWLDSADRNKGRLRSFLIIALKRFMSNEWDKASAQRRGGGQLPVPIDTEFAESRLSADRQSLAPDVAFDRQWAMTLIELTVNRLRGEFSQTGRLSEYEALKACLLAGRGDIDYASIASQLRISETASRVAVHRLRKRFREIYREEISHTLADGESLNEEMRYLASILAGQ